jgi:hypothetical protein
MAPVTFGVWKFFAAAILTSYPFMRFIDRTLVVGDAKSTTTLSAFKTKIRAI